MTFATYPSLEGKSVLISGGASGIGADTVRAFVAQGARVGFLDLDSDASERLTDETDGKAVHVTCDLRDIDAMRAAIAVLRTRVGPFSVLVNNAARDDRHDWKDVTPEYWDERLATNLRHMFFAIQAIGGSRPDPHHGARSGRAPYPGEHGGSRLDHDRAPERPVGHARGHRKTPRPPVSARPDRPGLYRAHGSFPVV